MKLPQSLTTVTPLSTFLAVLLFITLPLLGFLFGMQYQQQINFLEYKTPVIYRAHTGISPTQNPILNQPPANGGWHNFIEENYRFQFQYPSGWTSKIINDIITLQDNSGKTIVTISSFNPALVGITYCGANASDPRCEGAIDWGTGNQATAMLSESSKGISMTLEEVTPETKDAFRHIVATFQFLSGTVPTNSANLNGEVKLAGTVLENKKEERDNRVLEYLTINTNSGEQYKIIYYIKGPFDDCVIDSKKGRSLKPGDKINLIGNDIGNNQIITCNTLNDYFLEID